MRERKKMWHIGLVVPIEWRSLILRRIDMKGYISVSDYLRSLIREDLEKAGLLEMKVGEVG
ncbi:MAG: hypothetical protein B7O98_09555 [Zestosphaera tikiterensis]|uniref:Uncharacterized protein n=1 Tax=Zestosphaera tikiterensis TaxID=1973259 RepID=A0A2R7Y1G0_9CREN|nr:MAG: hypothetical protein B7O98_09555 [Zestosphaera tikiterensis]